MSVAPPRGVVPIPSDHEIIITSDDHDAAVQDKLIAHISTRRSIGAITSASQAQQSNPKNLEITASKGTTQELPVVPLLAKKESCKFTNVVSTCVNKASAHLELLQTLIEEWFSAPINSTCRGHSSPALKGSPSRKAAILNSTLQSGKQQTGLAVNGVGMAGQTHSIADELPYLGGMEVIEEVYSLLSRLEADRVETERLLFGEKQKGRMLQRKIEDLAAKRAREFPLAVQAEHDAAVEDLNELNWHVTYKARMEEKLRERVEHADLFNERLTEDIGFVQKHCPLVEEKLSLELGAMEKINEAQHESDRELELTYERLAKTKVRNDEAHNRAEKEREAMAKDIQSVHRELEVAIQELEDSRTLSVNYKQEIADTKRLIQENAEEKKVLTVKSENSKGVPKPESSFKGRDLWVEVESQTMANLPIGHQLLAESMKLKRVDELTNRLRMVDSERNKLEEELAKRTNEYEVLRSTLESQFAELTKACEYEEERLRNITLENENLLIEIDELRRKIEKAEAGIMEDERALRRINNQINNTESMMNQMLDEYSRVQIIHSATRDRLQEEKERIGQIEDALRQTLETLKKQCKDEIHTRGVLSARISSDGTELVKSQAEAKQKKETLAKTVVEIEQQLKVVVDKVDKLRDMYETKQKIYKELETEIEEIIETRNTLQENFVVTQRELNPKLVQLKKEHAKKASFLHSILAETTTSLLVTKELKMIRADVTRKEVTYGFAEFNTHETILVGHETLPPLRKDFKHPKIMVDASTQVDMSTMNKFKSIVERHLNSIAGENSDLRQEIMKVNNQMELMQRKKDEMAHSTRILEKSIRQNEMAVESLQKAFSEYTTQLEDQTKLHNDLLSQKDDVMRRIETRAKEHSQLMSERSETIQHHTVTLQSELAMNRGLAETYRKLNGQYVDLKSKVMDMFDERNRLEAGIKDLKQLKGLQSRMHRALETYYKFRGLFNSGELERVKAESRISAKKVSKLQDNYNQALDAITGFLHTQMKVLNNRQAVQHYTTTRAVGESVPPLPQQSASSTAV